MRKPLILLVAVLVLAGLASAQSFLTTTFTSNNGRSTPGAMNMFELTVLNPAGLKITSLDVNSSATVSTTINIVVYTTTTTYVGKEMSQTGWTQASKGAGQAAGVDTPTPVDVQDFTLAPGKYGVAIHYVDGGVKYTNGTGTGPTGNQHYANADLDFLGGVGTSALFSGTLFNPRVWNGTIHYSPAITATLAGTGTGGIGTSYTFALLSANEPTLTYGIGSSLGNGPIPIDTRSLGLSLDALLIASTGGTLPTLFVGYTGALDASGRAGAKLVIPKIGALKGLRIYTAFVTAKASSPSGISSISNTVDFMIG